jgi:hypothetical protein
MKGTTSSSMYGAPRFDTPPPLTPALQKLKTDVTTLAKQIARSWYSIGLLFRDAVGRKMWQGSEYPNIDAFWINQLKSVDLREVRRYAKVTRFYGPDIVAYGIAELDLYITWAHTQKIKLGDDPGPKLVTWTLNGIDHQKPFAECSKQDLQNAIASARKRPGHGGSVPGGKPHLSDLLQACMSYLQPKLNPLLDQDATHDFHAWVDEDVDADGEEEVLLRANAYVFFDACLKIGEAAKEFFASVDPSGKPRKRSARATRRPPKRRP